MNFYSVLLHTHSIVRYVALVFIVWAIIIGIKGIVTKKHFLAKDLKIALFTLISFHLQLVIGVLLYFISPKVIFSTQVMSNTMLRFFTVEHFVLMLIVVVLITIGYSKAKKNKDARGYRQIVVFYVTAFILILWAIPWPFRVELYSSWF